MKWKTFAACAAGSALTGAACWRLWGQSDQLGIPVLLIMVGAVVWFLAEDVEIDGELADATKRLARRVDDT